VDLDGGPAAAAFAKDIKADDALSVQTQGGPKESPHPLTLEEGRDQVRLGRVSACIVIPKGFEESSANMFGGGGGLKVEAIVDPGHKAEAGLLTGKLNELAFRQMSHSFTDPSKMTAQMKNARANVEKSEGLTPEQKRTLTTLFDSLDGVAGANLDPKPAKEGDKEADGFGGWRPVEVTISELSIDRGGRPSNSFEISFPQGVIWGLMGCMMGFGVGLVTERTAGTMLRLSAAPITRGQILLGKALGCFLACVAVQLILVAMGTIIGKLHIPRWDILLIAVVACGIGFSGLMMVVAGLSRTEGGASGMARGIVIMLAMIGGGSVPLFVMPPLVRKIASISPFKWAGEAIEGAVWRGYTLHDMLLPVGVLLAMGVAGYLIGASTMKRSMA
jgi:ABC-2 type transport system permease protein